MNKLAASILSASLAGLLLLSGCGSAAVSQTAAPSSTVTGSAEAVQTAEPSETASVSESAEPSPTATISVSPSAEDLEKSTIYVFSMDTVMTLTAYGPHRDEALQAAEDEVNRLNDLLSIGVETSEIATANRTGSATLSEDTATLINRALDVYDMTDGCFDITVTPLMELWGFTTQNYYVPTESEIATALKRTGIEKVSIDPETNQLTLADEAEIDLGGIAKGFTSARIMEIFEQYGVTSAIVSLGGNAQCLNLKPDGSKYKIGIRSPWGSEVDLAAIVEVEDKAVITSGGYERYFTDEETGKTYIHILDPKTGYPIENNLASVSIISDDGTLSDGLSTSLYIMGLDKASDFWRANKDKFDVIIITNDKEIYASSGIVDSIEPDSIPADYTLKTIE